MTKFKIAVVWMVFFAIIAILFSSCMTARNLPKHNDRYPEAALNYYKSRYPSNDSTIYQTDSVFTKVFIPVPRVDTFLFCDTVIHGVPAKKFTVDCPPSQTSTITVTKNIEHWQETPRYKLLELQYKGLQVQIEKQKIGIADRDKVIEKQRSKLWKAGLLIVLLVLWIFRKPLIQLFKILFAVVRSAIFPAIPPIS